MVSIPLYLIGPLKFIYEQRKRAMATVAWFFYQTHGINQGCFLGTWMQVLSINSVINWADTCYVLFVSHAQVCPDCWLTCSQFQLISSASHLQIFGNLVTTWLHVMSKSHPTLHQDKGSPRCKTQKVLWNPFAELRRGWMSCKLFPSMLSENKTTKIAWQFI